MGWYGKGFSHLVPAFGVLPYQTLNGGPGNAENPAVKRSWAQISTDIRRFLHDSEPEIRPLGTYLAASSQPSPISAPVVPLTPIQSHAIPSMPVRKGVIREEAN
jgi:hypothetical protein